MEPYILFVEDDPDDVELTLMGLKSAGFEPRLEIAHDGQEALARLQAAIEAKRPLPAALLLDIKLPKMDGLELLRRLRAMPPLRDVPAVFLTSSSFAADRAQALGLGARLYLIKPADLNGYRDIAARLRALVAVSTREPSV